MVLVPSSFHSMIQWSFRVPSFIDDFFMNDIDIEEVWIPCPKHPLELTNHQCGCSLKTTSVIVNSLVSEMLHFVSMNLVEPV